MKKTAAHSLTQQVQGEHLLCVRAGGTANPAPALEMRPIGGRDTRSTGTCLVEAMRATGLQTLSSGASGARMTRVDMAWTLKGQEGRFPAIGPCCGPKVNAEAKLGRAGQDVCTSRCGPPAHMALQGLQVSCEPCFPPPCSCPATWPSCQPSWRPPLHPLKVLASGSAGV